MLMKITSKMVLCASKLLSQCKAPAQLWVRHMNKICSLLRRVPEFSQSMEKQTHA